MTQSTLTRVPESDSLPSHQSATFWNSIWTPSYQGAALARQSFPRANHYGQQSSANLSIGSFHEFTLLQVISKVFFSRNCRSSKKLCRWGHAVIAKNLGTIQESKTEPNHNKKTRNTQNSGKGTQLGEKVKLPPLHSAVLFKYVVTFHTASFL